MTSQKRSKKQDALTLLIDDHKKVQKLFKDFEKAVKQQDDEEKESLAMAICAELTVHAQIEEEILYPAAREVLDDEDLVDEATVEHTSAKELIAQIESMQVGEELYDAKVQVLGEYVNHHIKEEQNELFPELKKSELDLEALGKELHSYKEELIERLGIESLIGSLKTRSAGNNAQQATRKSKSAH